MRFRRATLTGAAALALAGLITVSCGGVTDPSQNQTETFNGTVATRGGSSNPIWFNVSNTGEFTVKVTSFTPNYSGTFATYYGQGDGSTCLQLLQQNSFSTVNAPVLQGQIFKGLYCVVVADQVGAFPAAGEAFTMTISHP
jgi:hypothetical protein